MTSSKLEIDPDEVERAFLECLYRAEEVQNLPKGEAPEGAIIVDGITNKFGFQPDRLEHQREKVMAWLQALPHEFRESGGGGWSFLNACNQADGRQWTGLHLRMEQLFCLAMGLGLAKCLLPRDLWSALPGGVPYYAISTNKEEGMPSRNEVH